MANLRQRLPHLNTLVVFDAAYRLNSFSRAASELALSQSSVSRVIRQLEETLGVRLFDRGRYDVAATEAGHELATTVCRALRDIAQTTDRLRIKNDDTEALTIYTDLSLASSLLAPCIGEFQRQNPSLRLRIIASPEPIEHTVEAFDIGLQEGRWGDDQFHIEAIADDAIFPVCAPSILAGLSAASDPDEIARQPLLNLQQEGRNWPDWSSFLRAFGVAVPHKTTITVINTYALYLDLAELGEGIALGWARSVQDHLNSGRLVRIPGLTLPLPDFINVYRPKHRPTKPIVQDFLRMLKRRVPPVDL